MKLNERWSLRRDRYQWILTEHVPGMSRPKDGSEPQPITTSRESYHGTLEQAMRWCLDRSLDGCESAADLLACIEAAKSELCECCARMTVADVRGAA